MPIATPEVYAEMLENARAKGFAYPAVNVTSSQTLNAAIRGFAEAGSDGIIQASTGGAAYWSGPNKKNMVVGSSPSLPTHAKLLSSTMSISPCTPTTAPRTSSMTSCCPCSQNQRRL